MISVSAKSISTARAMARKNATAPQNSENFQINTQDSAEAGKMAKTTAEIQASVLIENWTENWTENSTEYLATTSAENAPETSAQIHGELMTENSVTVFCKKFQRGKFAKRNG